MAKAFHIIIICILALFIIAGCQGSKSNNAGAAPRTPFLGGTEGLQVKFIDGSPPKEVTDSGTFDFQSIVSLKNKGEFDLTRDQVKVDLIGFLPEDFGVSQEDLNDKRPEDDPTATALNWIESTYSGYDVSEGYNHRLVGGQDALVINDEWVIVKTPDGKKRISIVYSVEQEKGAQPLHTEFQRILDTFSFK